MAPYFIDFFPSSLKMVLGNIKKRAWGVACYNYRFTIKLLTFYLNAFGLKMNACKIRIITKKCEML
jgi:hypothetical protein